jgi:AcrR family transcriptional regulator
MVAKPKLAERRRLETREMILTGAASVFREHGYQDATVEEIANQAGVSRGTFYLHFKDKAEAAVAIGTRHLSRTNELFKQLDNMESPSIADVENWLHELTAHFRSELVALEVGTKASISSNDFAVEDKRIQFEQALVFERHLSGLEGPARELAIARLSLLQSQTQIYMYNLLVRGVTPAPSTVMATALAQIWLAELRGLNALTSQ